MLKHLKIISEELRIADVDDETLKAMKSNLLFRLGEYRDSALFNVEYNEENNEVEYKYFDKIDIRSMMRELNNELTEEFVSDLNVHEFLTSINELMNLKEPNIKRKIRKSFEEYYKSIDSKIEEIKSNKNKNKDMNIKPFNSFNEEKENTTKKDMVKKSLNKKKSKKKQTKMRLAKESAEYDNDNYMFFANLQHIVRMASEIMEMDESEIDEMLTDGHDWANDHISKSMESIEHVYNFLLSSLNGDELKTNDIEDIEDKLEMEKENPSVKKFNDFE